jgi:hypothetical protein
MYNSNLGLSYEKVDSPYLMSRVESVTLNLWTFSSIFVMQQQVDARHEGRE